MQRWLCFGGFATFRRAAISHGRDPTFRTTAHSIECPDPNYRLHPTASSFEYPPVRLNEGRLCDSDDRVRTVPIVQPRSFQPENHLDERAAAWPVSSVRSRHSGQSNKADMISGPDRGQDMSANWRPKTARERLRRVETSSISRSEHLVLVKPSLDNGSAN